MNNHIIDEYAKKCVKCEISEYELKKILYAEYSLGYVHKVMEKWEARAWKGYKYGQIYNEFPATANCISDDEFIIKQIIT